MQINYGIIERLQGIFEESWNRVKDGAVPVCVPQEKYPAPSEVWTLYMNTHDVLIIEHEDLVENFDDMVNFGSAVKDSVCIHNPADHVSFLLVPPELAEKCLVLGTLV